MMNQFMDTHPFKEVTKVVQHDPNVWQLHTRRSACKSVGHATRICTLGYKNKHLVDTNEINLLNKYTYLYYTLQTPEPKAADTRAIGRHGQPRRLPTATSPGRDAIGRAARWSEKIRRWLVPRSLADSNP